MSRRRSPLRYVSYALSALLIASCGDSLSTGDATLPNGALQGSTSMLERLINVSLTPRRLVCLAGLELMRSGLYAFRHVVC